MAFCNPCVRPTNSSILTHTRHPTTSIKTLLRRQLLKKSSTLIQPRTPIHHSKSNARFQRVKGTNYVREVNPIAECSFQTDSTNNYDMTLFHDDIQETLSHRRAKKIPDWARKSQLQLAFINQIYFNTNPDDIFGSIQMDVAHQMVESIQLRNIPCPDLYSSPLLPPNFV